MLRYPDSKTAYATAWGFEVAFTTLAFLGSQVDKNRRLVMVLRYLDSKTAYATAWGFEVAFPTFAFSGEILKNDKDFFFLRVSIVALIVYRFFKLQLFSLRISLNAHTLRYILKYRTVLTCVWLTTVRNVLMDMCIMSSSKARGHLKSTHSCDIGFIRLGLL